MKRKLAMAVGVTVLFVIIAASLLSIKWTARPVIDYYMTGYDYDVPGKGIVFDFNPYVPFYTSTMPNSYTVVNSNTPLMVAIHWQNKANIHANLRLTLSVTNAKITWFSNYSTLKATDPGFSTPSTGQTYNGPKITFNFETEANSTVQNRYLNIFPAGNPQNFTITYSITDTSNAFSFIPVGKTSATYELTSENAYQFVK